MGAGGQSFLTEIDLQAADHASPAIEALHGKLGSLAATVSSLAGIDLGDFGVEHIIHTGAEAVRIFDSLQMSVTGLVYAYTTLQGESGKLEDGTAKLGAASRAAGEQLEAVKDIAVRLGLNEETTAKAFAGMFQAMTQLGGSSRQQIEFMETLGAASKTLGMSLDDAAAALSRMVATGNVSSRSQLGRSLIALGVSSQDLKDMMAAGDGLEQLTERLSKLADASKGAAPTFDNAMQRMRNALQNLGEGAAKPALESIKGLILDFVARISHDGSLGSAFEGIGEHLASIAQKLAPLLESLFRLGVKLAEASAKLSDSLASVAGWVKPIIDFIGNAVDGLGKWAPAIIGAAGALGTFTVAAKAALAIPGLGALLGGSGGAVAGAAGAIAGAAAPVAVGVGVLAGLTALYQKAFVAPQQAEAQEAYERAKDVMLTNLKRLAVLAADPEVVTSAREAMAKLAAAPASEEALAAASEAFKKLRAAMTGEAEGGFDTTTKIGPELLEQVKEKIKALDAEIQKASAGGSMSTKLLGVTSDYTKSVDELDKMAGAWRKNTPEVEALYQKAAQLRSLKLAELIREIGDETEKLRVKNKALRDEIGQIGLEGPAKELAKGFSDATAKVDELDRQIEIMKRDIGSAVDATSPKDAKGMAAIDAQLQQLSALMEQRGLEAKKGAATIAETVRVYVKGLSEDTFKAMTDEMKASGMEYEAAWEELNHATAERVRIFEMLIAQVPKGAAFDALRKALVDGLNAYTAATQAANDRAKGLANAESAAAVGNFSEAWTYIASLPAKTFPEYKRNLETWIKLLQDFGTTGSAGVARAFAEIAHDVKNEADVMHDYVKGTWDDLGGSLKKGFFEAFKGNADGLKQVWQGLIDSFIQRWADMLADLVQKWLATKLFFGENSLLGAGAVGSPSLAGAKGGGGSTGTYYAGSGEDIDAGGGGGGTGVVGYAAAGYGIYKGVQGALKQNKEAVSYGGVNLGEMNFGGDSFGSKLAPWLAAAAAVATTGIGIVVAAVVAVVGIIVSLFNGPKEGHVTFALNKALEGARDGINGLVGGIIDGTANYVGELAQKAFGGKAPEKTREYVQAYRDQFKKLYGSAAFDIAAGSAEDIQKDMKQFFEQTLPKMALQGAFGQVGYGPHGNRDAQGGQAGLDWNMNNEFMDKEGNWIQKQLYDPEAPIPKMLTGLGFTGDRVKEIAQKLADTSDIEAFKKWLNDLVGVVVDLSDLAAKFGRSVQEWRDAIKGEDVKQGTAAQFQDAVDSLVASGSLLDTVFGDDRVKAGQELVKTSQQLLDQEESALRSIFETIDQLTQQSAMIASGARDKLKTPGELEGDARGRLAGEFKAITDAANPKEVAAAWQAFAKDLSSVLDAIVARIQSIKKLQQDYEDFKAIVADRNAPKFADDPKAWLAENEKAIASVRESLKTATGDEAVSGAARLLALTKERYNAELDMLNRVRATVKAIDSSIAKSLEDLQLQSIGSVDPATGEWKADVHGQGDFMMARIKELQGQLGTAKTPEEVQRITAEIQSYVQKLGAQPQEGKNFEESRKVLMQILKDTQDAADKRLAGMDEELSKDLDSIGEKLGAGETALADALDAAQKDFEETLKLLDQATTAATDGLNAFAEALVTQMAALTEAIKGWIALFTGVDPTGGPGGTTPGPSDVWEDDPDDPDYEICISGPSKGKRRRKRIPKNGPDEQPGPGGANVTGAAPPAVNVTVNANGSPEEVAKAAADAVYAQVVEVVKQNNVDLVNKLRNNMALLTPGR